MQLLLPLLCSERHNIVASMQANGYGDAVTCERNQVFEGTCLPDTDCECVNGGLVAVLSLAAIVVLSTICRS